MDLRDFSKDPTGSQESWADPGGDPRLKEEAGEGEAPSLRTSGWQPTRPGSPSTDPSSLFLPGGASNLRMPLQRGF